MAAAGGGLALWGYRRQHVPGPEESGSLVTLADRFRREETGSFPDLVVARGKAIPDEKAGIMDPRVAAAMLDRALAELGGMKRFVRPGSSVLVKPNAAFAADPRTGAITDPHMIAAVVRAAKAAGARTVFVVDNPIAAPALVFDRTGIRRAVENAGGKVLFPTKVGFRRLRIPEAEVIPDWPVLAGVFAAADTVIGIATVKDHNLCTASMTMKNWYGLLGGNRSQFHQHIHQAICDLWRLVRFTSPLLILDGSRVLLRNGPTGGSATDVVVRNTLAVGTDPVAIDSFGATLLDREPAEIEYLVRAETAGFGSVDYKRNWKEV